MKRADTLVVFSDHGMTALPSEKIWPILTLSPDKPLALFRELKNPRTELDYMTTEKGIEYVSKKNSEAARQDFVAFKKFLESVRLKETSWPLYKISEAAGPSGSSTFLVQFNMDVLKIPIYKASLLVDDRPVDLYSLLDLSLLEADHAGNGLFMMTGNGVKSLRDSEDLYLTDVAPTVLALFGLAPGARMDGAVARNGLDPAILDSLPKKAVRYAQGQMGLISLASSIKWKQLLRHDHF
jgi:hypothetical protein